MRYLFNEILDGQPSWAQVFQSIEAFAPLASYLLEKENLPPAAITHLTPGTNAVFRAGAYVLKIFAPEESGFCVNDDFNTEMFGLCLAEKRGVPVSALVAHGCVDDRYAFRYMVLRFIEGPELEAVFQTMTDSEKESVGVQLRAITDTLNTPMDNREEDAREDASCLSLANTDYLLKANRNERWAEFPETFRAERLEYINHRAFGERVFVHGDLNADNIIVGPGGRLYILDFADALLAPRVYEHALLACAFNFAPPFMRGYFGSLPAEDITDICLDGLLLHEFGGPIIRDHFGDTDALSSIKILRERILYRSRAGLL